ncbi:MAG: TraR/DksA family transcriptional regulator [Saprospiraceae bacterium]
MATPKKNTPLRYSDEELAEFKELIDNKIANAQEQVNQLEEQVLELNESLQTSGADLGDNSAYSDVEFMNNLIFRQKKHIQDLENALLRIKNKVYGICTLTGDLIDKKRLLAVPTTTKGLIAKTEHQKRSAARSNPRRTLLSDRKPSNTFSKKTVKKKVKTKKVQPSTIIDDEEDDFELDADQIDEVDMGDVTIEDLDD